MRKDALRLLTYTALLTAASLIVGVIEHMLPPVIPMLPFVRIGFSNVVVLFSLLALGWKPALIIVLLKSTAVPLFVGNPVMAAYSLPSSLMAFGVMFFAVRILKTALPNAGIAGAFFHNLTQLAVASLMTGTAAVFGFLPYLLLIGSAAGFATGAIAFFAVRYLPAELLPD